MAHRAPPLRAALHADQLVVAEPRRTLVLRAHEKLLQRGTHRSVQALNTDIRLRNGIARMLRRALMLRHEEAQPGAARSVELMTMVIVASAPQRQPGDRALTKLFDDKSATGQWRIRQAPK